MTVADPAAAAVAEYLWLSGDDAPEILEQLDRILAAGVELGAPWPSGAFAFWMWKLGRLHEAPGGTADFYAWIMNGEYPRSVEFFAARGLHYEEALALMHGTEHEQIRAVRIFDDLGTVAASTRVRRLLVEQGARLTRGQSRATRRHPAGLTLDRLRYCSCSRSGTPTARSPTSCSSRCAPSRTTCPRC